MKFKELSPNAQMFLINYLDKSLGKVKKNSANQKVIDDYVELTRLENEFKLLMRDLKDDRRLPQVSKLAQGYSEFKKKGQFETACNQLQRAITLGNSVKSVMDLENRLKPILDEAGSVSPPNGAPGDDVFGLNLLKAAVGNCVTQPIPKLADVASATGALEQLRAERHHMPGVMAAVTTVNLIVKALPDKDSEAARANNTMVNILVHRRAGRFAKANEELNKLLRSLAGAIETHGSDLPASSEAMQAQAESLRAEFQELAENGTTEEKQKATEGLRILEKMMLDGPLAPNARRRPGAGTETGSVGLATMAKLLEAFKHDPKLAQTGLEISCSVTQPDTFALGLLDLSKHVDSRLKVTGVGGKKDEQWQHPSKDTCRTYGEHILKQAKVFGGKFLEEFGAYAKKGKFLEGEPFGKPQKDESSGHQRSRVMAGALLNDEGKITLDSEKLGPLVDHMKFHVDGVRSPTAQTSLHIEATLEQLKNPLVLNGINEVLAKTKPPIKGSAGDQLIRKSLGLNDDVELSESDVKQALMTSLLSPVFQGPVGSCFATAPVMDLRSRDPVLFLEKLSSIATNGTLPIESDKGKLSVPSVTRLPSSDKGDPLIRSLEYTVATAGAMKEDSNQRKKLREQCKAAIERLLTPALADGAGEIASQIATKFDESIVFDYDPTAKVTDAGDGSSSSGHFVIKIDGTTVDNVELFRKYFESAINETCKDLVTDDQDKLRLSRNLSKLEQYFGHGTGTPWNLKAGDSAEGSLEAIWGKSSEQVNITSDVSKDGSKSERSAGILKSVLETLAGKDGDQHTFGIEGVHAFNILPDNPSLKKLSGEGGDLTTAIAERLLKPGKAIADGEMSAEVAGKLFDSLIDQAESSNVHPKYKPLIANARKMRPTKPIKPGDLSDLVQLALEDHTKLRAAHRVVGGNDPPDNLPSQGRLKNELEKMQTILKKRAQKILVSELAPPEVILADSNWGDENEHGYFVMTTDPVTGEFGMWKRSEPSGEMIELGEGYTKNDWKHCKVKR